MSRNNISHLICKLFRQLVISEIIDKWDLDEIPE